MPPMPVAAPSTGTTCEGWLWLSCADDEAPPLPVPGLGEAHDAGVLARAEHDVRRLGRQVRLEHPRGCSCSEQCSLHIVLKM